LRRFRLLPIEPHSNPPAAALAVYRTASASDPPPSAGGRRSSRRIHRTLRVAAQFRAIAD
jgi:hypothetical protein